MKKMKALTFSYDDGVTQDIRLAEMFNRYGLKCTFNLCSGHLGKQHTLIREGKEINHSGVPAQDAAEIYAGHEIAVHTVHHPFLTRLSDEEVIRETEEDRKALESLAGYPISGMAYPCGDFDDRVVGLLEEKTPIRYARTVISSGNFDVQTDLLRFQPTVYHMDTDEMFRLGREFLELKPDSPKIFYVWGHSYEFDLMGWDRMEEFCAMMSGRDDIFYGTNREVLLSTF